jgi:hypothetical protein
MPCQYEIAVYDFFLTYDGCEKQFPSFFHPLLKDYVAWQTAKKYNKNDNAIGQHFASCVGNNEHSMMNKKDKQHEAMV